MIVEIHSAAEHMMAAQSKACSSARARTRTTTNALVLAQTPGLHTAEVPSSQPLICTNRVSNMEADVGGFEQRGHDAALRESVWVFDAVMERQAELKDLKNFIPQNICPTPGLKPIPNTLPDTHTRGACTFRWASKRPWLKFLLSLGEKTKPETSGLKGQLRFMKRFKKTSHDPLRGKAAGYSVHPAKELQRLASSSYVCSSFTLNVVTSGVISLPDLFTVVRPEILFGNLFYTKTI